MPPSMFGYPGFYRMQKTLLFGTTKRSSPGIPRPAYMVFLFLLVTIGILVLPVCGDSTLDTIQAANNVYVSNYTLDPAVLFAGDTATATFYVTNGNANQSVMVNHATFGDNDILLTSGSYNTNVNIGPSQTRSFVFSIGTDKPEEVGDGGGGSADDEEGREERGRGERERRFQISDF